KLVVADEPVSALDVSIQAQMINLLEELQDEFSLTYVFIAHDLGVVRHVSDRIAVMYLGRIMELSPAEELYERPIMPYTEALLSAVPIPDPDLSDQRERIVLEGDVPSPINPPSGCRFHPRCRYATEICSQVDPPLADYGNGHLAACHHPLNVDKATLARVTVSAASPAETDETALPEEPGKEVSHPVTGS
ncbi:MAG: ABC transporter ATP-binding protein, partial [Actinobacteria bacterium]